MKFKDRPFGNPVVCGPTPVLTNLGPWRVYRAREQISLRPDPKGLHDELHAEVLGMSGEKLKVCALHPFYFSPTECLVKQGEVFEVSRDKVYHVILPE